MKKLNIANFVGECCEKCSLHNVEYKDFIETNYVKNKKERKNEICEWCDEQMFPILCLIVSHERLSMSRC